ncbi:MAG: rhodanese-like domain-containing protein [Proteobacteria bacterium]|nr:rhodanese-like domain-containing protein [Pseudomonadota bacterium]
MSQLVEFAGNHVLMVMAFMTVLFLYLYTLYNEKSRAFKSVSTDQLTRLVNHQNAKIIDVRNAESFKKGHIVNAIHMPLADIISGKAKIDSLKKSPVIAYCDRGNSSLTACNHLSKAGIASVFNLTGGVNAWVTDKLPLSK